MPSDTLPHRHQNHHEASPLLPRTTADELERGENNAANEVSPFQLEQSELDFFRQEAQPRYADFKERVLLVATTGLVFLTMGACYSVVRLQDSLAGFTSKMIPMAEIP